MTASALSLSVELIFFRTDFQHILHRSIDFERLGFLLLLPFLVVVYQIQPANVVKLQ